MSLPATWRQFQLFDFLPIKDPNFQSHDALFSDPHLSAICAVQGHLVIAVNCFLKIVNKKSLTLARQFCAYDDAAYKITFIKPLPSSNILVTIAENQGAPVLIKVWDLQKILGLDAALTKNDDAMSHKYITAVLVHDGDDAFPVSCFSFNEGLTCIALGYANGKIVLVRGDLLRDRGLKQRLIYEGTDPITSVQFHRSEEILYVATTSRIFTLLTTGRSKGKPLRVLSKESGADLDCTDIEKSSKLLVANSDGFSYYNTVSKAQVVGFSVPKRKMLRLFRHYVLVVCSMQEASATLTKLLVLDMHNMHISFSLTIPNLAVLHVFSSADHEAFLLSTDGVLYKLEEKPVHRQIELVVERELFPIALNLAHQHSLDGKTLLKINRLYAEYLYEKQDYGNSTKQFIACLPYLEPSVQDTMAENLDDFIIDVITKFKEVSNIHHMTEFLKRLYELKLADCDHLTLLLCCYCKLKMVDELDVFITTFDLSENSDFSKERLDLNKLNYPLIVNLFKECGYYSQVTLLLYKLNQPHKIVDIQLNDLKEYQACLSYIKTLPVNELLGILIDYLMILLNFVPLETTKLLIDVFTGKFKPEKSHSLFELENETPLAAEPEKSADELAGGYSYSYNAILGYISSTLKQDLEDTAVPQNADSDNPTYLPPRPSLVFSCFINHLKEFVVFLEACHLTLEKYQGSVQERQNLISTLFEMYASLYAENTEEADSWAGKARLFFAENADSIDKARAQLIAHMYGLEIDDVLIRANVDHSEENAFRTAQMAGDYDRAMEIVRQYGNRKPALFKQMLKFSVSSKDVFAQASRRDFQFIIDHVTKFKLATPLEIVKILSSNESASIGIVKDFLIDYFSDVNREIANSEKLIELYETESTRDSVKLSELQSQPFALQNDLCASCQIKLEFPLIHFKCKHSYHQRCLSENTYIPENSAKKSVDPTCPLCAGDIRNVEALREDQLRTHTELDMFKMKLDESDDRFKVMCEYIGRGALDL